MALTMWRSSVSCKVMTDWKLSLKTALWNLEDFDIIVVTTHGKMPPESFLMYKYQ